jgi:predicted dehydrogenase
LNLARADFYEKEISFQVSCSYGPGRYDLNYEQLGNDYPLGFVRWTAQRNFDAALQMLASGRIKIESLVTHRYSFDDSSLAYKKLLDDPRSLGIVLQYPNSGNGTAPRARLINWESARSTSQSAQINVGVFGAGNYASRVLIPCFAKAGANLEILVNTGSLAGAAVARRNGFSALSTDAEAVFNDERVNTMVIATRHDSHASLAIRAIEAGKHVFVEKPLTLTIEQLEAVQRALQNSPSQAARQFCVGFNRRFAPLAMRMRQLLNQTAGPKSAIYTVNAGAISAKHWTQQMTVGGGRIVGECCHFIDFLRYLIGAPIESFDAKSLSAADAPHDTVSITLRFADGSIGSVHYFSNGARAFPKERVEVFAAGSTLQLDNFRRLHVFGKPQRGMRSWRQDKGQQHLVDEFVRRAKGGGEQLIPLQEIFEVMRISILAQMSVDAQ